MSFVQNFPFFSILLTLVGGVVCPLFRQGRKAFWFTIALLCVVAGLSAGILQYTVATGSSFVYWMGHYPAPWGNELRVGILESLLALVFTVVMILSLLGGKTDFFAETRPKRQHLYFMIVTLLMASLLVMCYTNDLFTAYVFLEIGALTAAGLVMAKENGETTVATIRYLVFSCMGSGLFLFGVSILYRATGHLLMENLNTVILSNAAQGIHVLPMAMSFGMMAVGLGIKSALFPFHGWLPSAHGSATTPSSAILSGLVLKGYLVLLAKLVLRIFSPELCDQWHITELMFAFGAAAMLLGSLRAIRQQQAKRMLAYSSIAQIGYVYLAFGLGTSFGIAAGFVQMLSHAVTKPMLFCAAGSFSDSRNHQKSWARLRGVAHDRPFAGIIYTVGALSMIGLPLLAGFGSKYLIAASALATPLRLWLTLATLAASAVLNALYYVPTMISIWRKEEDQVVQRAHPSPSFLVGTGLLLCCNLALGLYFTPLFHLIQTGVHLF